MKLTDKPAQIGVPFASSGDMDTIPVNATQDTKENGKAAWDSGFPPLTMTAIAAGGIPPSGKDFNGVLNAISAGLRFAMAGGLYPYNSDFSTAIGGYPLGAILISADGSKVWWNTSDANTTDPDSESAEGWKNLLQDPDGLFLRKDQNLADLQNKGTARENLELDKVGNWPAVQANGGLHSDGYHRIFLDWAIDNKLYATVDSSDVGALFTTHNPPTPKQVGAFPSKGGTVGSDGVTTPFLFANDHTAPLNRQGTWIQWNESNGRGESAFINNRGGGSGGFKFRVINDDNTQELGSVEIGGDGKLYENSKRVYSAHNPPPYPVTSVNGSSGNVWTANASLGEGWWKDNATGLIIQAGASSNSSSNTEVKTFNISFPNACLAIVGTIGTGVNLGNVVYLEPANSVQFTAKVSGGSIGYRWLAIGY